MIAYADSSVLLRIALDQGDPLAEFGDIDQGVTSSLTEVECFRTLDRLRVRRELTDADVAAARGAIISILAKMEILDLSKAVLRRAASPMPTQLTTLDALHLASALLWRDATGQTPTMATHDTALAMAAQAHGMPVAGV